MKYIVTDSDNKKEFSFLFPESIAHNFMHEGCLHIPTGPGVGRERDTFYGEVLGAGFVMPDGTCYRNSETLRIASRPKEDREVVKSSFPMHYIIIKDKHGKELPFLFSSDLPQEDMAVGIRAIRIGSPNNWERSLRTTEIVAAGLVDENFQCVGTGHGLDAVSRGEVDTTVIIKNF